LLFSSYILNIWQISPIGGNAHIFDKGDESLIAGRLARSGQDGIFSYGGLPGRNIYIDTSDISNLPDPEMLVGLQYHLYLSNEPVPDPYNTYQSQIGGQGILYSIGDKIAGNYIKPSLRMYFYRVVNALLLIFIFMLFIAWAFRNFGMISSIISLFLIFLSPWLHSFSQSIWWCLWSYFLPFIGVLIFLEKRQNDPARYNYKKLFLLIFIAVFLKCFFTGYEYISASVLGIIPPMVYYFIIGKEKYKKVFILFFKSGIAAVLAIIFSLAILLVQIRSLMGSFEAGIQHIVYSYIKRSTFSVPGAETNIYPSNLSAILKVYLDGSAFDLDIHTFHIRVSFLSVIVIMLVSILIIYRFKSTHNRVINKSLIYSSIISVIAPLSWFFIFKQHAYAHTHLDFIVWYIPFLPYTFLIIGQAASLILSRIFSGDNSKEC
jgi:hypothetical protein